MKKIFVFFSVLFLIFTMNILSASAEVNSKRLDGTDRFEVAVNVSKAGWPNGTKTVFLANYKAFADALAASPLAFKEDSPILLTQLNELNGATKKEILRLGAVKAVLVGGPGSISEKVIEDLNAIGIKDIERISGTDRFEVAYNIAMKLGGSEGAIVANGLNFPDALSIAPYASIKGYPILLTQSTSLHPKMKEAIETLHVSHTIISGGEASVGPKVAAVLPNVKRIGGKDRFEVSANIIKQLYPKADKSFLATGMTFADALTGSVLAAKENAPMLLASPTFTPPSVKDIILAKNIKDFTILGGNSSVPNERFLILTGQAPEPVKPSPSLEGKVIVLDPGHGGADPGAVKNGYKEVDLNNAFTLKLASHLTKMGAKVIYTRNPNENIFVDLPMRAKIANNSKADLFVSIHHDSNISPQPRGLSLHYSSYRPAIETKDVYVLSGGVKYPFVKEDTERKVFIVKNGSSTKALSYNGPNIAYDPTPSQAAIRSKLLAGDLAKALVYPGINISQIYSRTGVKDHNLYVTRWTSMPSVLIELGFISNPDEVKLLANSSIQEKRAHAMAEAIKVFYSK